MSNIITDIEELNEKIEKQEKRISKLEKRIEESIKDNNLEKMHLDKILLSELKEKLNSSKDKRNNLEQEKDKKADEILNKLLEMNMDEKIIYLKSLFRGSDPCFKNSREIKSIFVTSSKFETMRAEIIKYYYSIV